MSYVQYPWDKDAYNRDDHLDIQSRFGFDVRSAPAILPAFNNYYQDISGGNSEIGNLTLVNGERLFPAGQPHQNYPDFKWKWFVNGKLVSEKSNPTYADFRDNMECSGVMRLMLWVEHRPTGVIFEREQWAYIQYNDLGQMCNVVDAPPPFGVFYPFYPDVDVYEEYAIMPWDLNGDKRVSTGDMVIFLQKFDGNS